MMACIWSCPTNQMLQFPVSTMIRFCHNHGLIQVSNRPQWWTVKGGARHYVDKIVSRIADKRLNAPVKRIERLRADQGGGVRIFTGQAIEHFDKVVVATHSDQALALLGEPTAQERRTLGAIKYQANRAVLHTDVSVLPRRRLAWAAWNYARAADTGREQAAVCLHYLINRLQPLPWQQPVVVSLNPLREIPSNNVMGEYHYAHPVFDLAAIKAQEQVPQLQGQRDTYFCGAWMGSMKMASRPVWALHDCCWVRLRHLAWRAKWSGRRQLQHDIQPSHPADRLWPGTPYALEPGIQRFRLRNLLFDAAHADPATSAGGCGATHTCHQPACSVELL